MFGCFRKGDANDPDIYVAAIAAVLAEYPQGVIDYVTDPRTGLPRRSKWLPNPAEVAEACEEQMAPVRQEQARRKQIEQQLADRERPAATPEARSSVNTGFRSLSETLRAATGEKLQPKAEDAA